MESTVHIDSALRTERLVLRPLEAADAPALLRLYGDPEVTKDNEIATLTCLEQAEVLLRAYLQFHRRFALISVGDAELIGTCGYALWDEASRMASFGYDLARPYWGHGLMREAAATVLGYGFAVICAECVQQRGGDRGKEGNGRGRAELVLLSSRGKLHVAQKRCSGAVGAWANVLFFTSLEKVAGSAAHARQ